MGSEHERAIALELTRIYYQTAVSKNLPIENIGKVDVVYLDILKSISEEKQDPVPPICASKTIEQTSPVLTEVAANS